MTDLTWLEKAKTEIQNSSMSSSVYIGCDSIRFKKRGEWYAKYSTVIVLHKDSRHGCTLHHNTEVVRDYGNLRQRLMAEVGYAISAALEIVDCIGDRHLEIHLDINPNPMHKSNVAIKEALGYVKGTLGIDAKVKPDGWAATHGADHVVRH